MKQRLFFAFLFSIATFAASATVSAAVVPVFQDDFESGLGKWNPNFSGQIVVDPINGPNKVLNFTANGSGGDIFSIDSVIAATSYKLEFDYMTTVIGPPGTGGGFLGIFKAGPPFTEQWVAGNPGYPGLLIQLISDGKWHHYSQTFSPNAGILGNNVSIKIEDFGGASPVQPLDAYFDNISLAAVPEPATLCIWAGLGLVAAGGAYRRRKALAA